MLALVSVAVLWSALRRTPIQPTPSATAEPSEPAQQPASSSALVVEDPRWHVETLSDHLPDGADRRRVLRWFIVVGIACLASVTACCVGAGVTGDLTFMALAVMLAVPTLVIFYAVARHRADL